MTVENTTRAPRITAVLTPDYIEEKAQAAKAAKAAQAAKAAKAAKPIISAEQREAAAKARAEKKAAGAYTFAALAASTIAAFLLNGSAFYGKALAYHAAKSTTFPRARNASEIARLSALSQTAAKAEVDEIIRQHNARVLHPGNKVAQSMFDLFMANRKT